VVNLEQTGEVIKKPSYITECIKYMKGVIVLFLEECSSSPKKLHILNCAMLTTLFGYEMLHQIENEKYLEVLHEAEREWIM
jgi:hypothetical protein